MKQHIPNALTSANLACGFLGIIQCFEGELFVASWLILLAAVFDFFDGFVARALKVSGEMGKELDSLADVVSFGCLPAIILYKLIQPSQATWAYVAVFIAVFSALRLAKFNIDKRQSDRFIGVPTPANALLIGSFPLIFYYQTEINQIIDFLPVYLAIAAIMPLLLVAELPLIALKFKNYSFTDNKFKYILLASSVLLLLLFKFLALPLIIILYIVLSVIENITAK